ncbi:MAG TPA: hypothetical protein VK537_02955 [Galbitalea sp.]|nr:hypothetical protein [Galbitalea sp.]
MQAQLGAVTGFERPDDFAARDNRASRQRREHRFVAGEDAARVRNRKHVPVDDESGKVHDAVRRCVDRAGRLDIDAAMSGRVWRRRRNERAKDLV